MCACVLPKYADYDVDMGISGSTMVTVLCYKSDVRWFEPSCQWIFHLQKILPDRTMALGPTQPLTEMITSSISWG